MHPPDRARSVRIRAAATEFLRIRPLVVGVAALLSGSLLVTSPAPREQVTAIGATMAAGCSLMIVESLVLRTRQVTESWILATVALTLIALGVATSLSGGPTSPFVPLVAAPVIVGIAAFGREPRGLVVLGLGVLTVAVVMLVPPLLPPLPREHLAEQVAVASIATFVLAWLGITGLAEAQVGATRAADAMREGVLGEAAGRSREAEGLGARVAHELRNPLTAAKALVQLVARSEVSPKDGERLGVVLGEIERMEQTLTDYLSLARPLTDVAKEPLDLADLVRGAAAVLEARAGNAGVSIVVHAAPAPTVADPRRLREALLNLSLNAIQALPSGGTLTLSSERDGETARLVVEDDGPGISPDVLERLFEPFVTGREGGTGLGLSLARSVARMHGGELHVGSTPGKGTRAVLEVPGS